MTVNLQSFPYYDDYDSKKNFQRILYKPGVAIQSRELNQVQSITHNQFTRLGDSVVGEGSRVTNDPISFVINDEVRSVKLSGLGANITTYANTYITGATSNTVGKVKFTYNADDPAVGDPPTLVMTLERIDGPVDFGSSETLYFYNNITDAIAKNASFIASEIAAADVIVFGTGTAGAEDNEILLASKSAAIKVGDQLLSMSSNFTQGLVVTEIVSDTLIRLNKNIGDVLASSTTLSFYRKNTTPTNIVTVTNGTYYKKGYFIDLSEQSIVPDKYTAYPTKSVILKYVETLIDYNDDETLLDPAFYSSNYLAPGADRLKVTLEIAVVDLNTSKLPDTTDDHIEIVRFDKGIKEFVEQARDTLPIKLREILAERTFDESGNYDILPFRLSAKGSTFDDAYAKFDILPGKVVIGGQVIETVGPTEILVPKSKDFLSIEDQFLDTTENNYALINHPSFGFVDQSSIRLYDTLEAHSTTDRTAMSTSTRVGGVIVKHIVYDGGEGNNRRYRLYWYYTYLEANRDWKNVKSLIGVNSPFTSAENNLGTYSTPTFFANVNTTFGLDANNLLKVYDAGTKEQAFYPITSNYLKDVNNIRIYYNKTYENRTVSASTVTITLTGDEEFVGSGTLSNAVKRQYYMIIVRSSSSGTLSAGQPVDVDNIIMDLDATKKQLTLTFSTLLVTGSVDVNAVIYNSEFPRSTKTLVTNTPVKAEIIGSNTPIDLYIADIYRFNGIYKIGSNTYHGSYTTTNSYVTNDIVVSNGLVYQALSGSTNVPVSNTSVWFKIPKENSLLYDTFNGQYDAYIVTGSLTYKGNINTYNPGNVVVILDYFNSNRTGVVDFTSYPASIQNNIPYFRSALNGAVYNMRNYLDFRPIKNNTSNASLMYNGINTPRPNPVLPNALQVDYDYYVPRIDRLYVQNRAVSKDRDGYNFYLDKGVPSLVPNASKDISGRDQQLIATLVVPPFTQSASDIKIYYNDSPRYTMKKIENLDTRLGSLERRVKKQGLDIIALNNQVFEGGSQANLYFKTGILVDDFTGYASNDIRNPFSTCIPAQGELLPAFSAAAFSLYSTSAPDFSIKTDLLTFNQTGEETFIQQVENTVTSAGGGPDRVTPNPGGVQPPGIVAYSNPVLLASGLYRGYEFGKGLIFGKDSADGVQIVDRSAEAAAQAELTLSQPGGVLDPFNAGGVAFDASAAALAATADYALLGVSLTAAEAAAIAAASEFSVAYGAVAVAETSFAAAAWAGIVEVAAVATAILFGLCFEENSKITLANGRKKAIKDIKVGDKILNHDGTKINTVKFKVKSVFTGELVSPNKTKPFGTINHPLIINGEYYSYEPNETPRKMPWIKNVKPLSVYKKSLVQNKDVFNLFVDGDGTYQVNNFGTSSIWGDGGALFRGINEKIITTEEALEILSAVIQGQKMDMYLWYITNKLANTYDSMKLKNYFDMLLNRK